jgi:membrane protein required for colicin V production
VENINLFDIVVVTLIVLLGLKGLFRGFARELFGIIGIVGGVFVASRLGSTTGEMINGIIPMQNENTILLSGFIATLVVFWIIAYIVGMTITKVLCASGLGIFDRLFGFVFGASKIFLLFAIISHAVTQVKMINDNLQPKLKNSVVFPIMAQAGAYIIKLDTSKIQKQATQKLDEAIEATKESIQKATEVEIQKQIQQKIDDVKKSIKEQTSETK